MGSLILSRKVNQSLLVILESGETLEVQTIEVRGRQVKFRFIGCEKTFNIKRRELIEGEGPDVTIEHRQTERAFGEDRGRHGQDEAPPEGLLPDS